MKACLAAALVGCTIATTDLGADLKEPSPSDALFDPSRVIQIEIRLDPKDWHQPKIQWTDSQRLH